MTTSTRHFKYIEDSGDIEVEYSGEELLPGRADINLEKGGYKKTFRGESGKQLGGMKPPLERELEQHEKQLGWKEPTPKKLDVLHVCPVCGTKFMGRTNKIYCSERCGSIARMRKQRAKKKEQITFKPHFGKVGEVYFKTIDNQIGFIPANYTKDRKTAEGFIKAHFKEEVVDNYTKQIEEVVK